MHHEGVSCDTSSTSDSDAIRSTDQHGQQNLASKAQFQQGVHTTLLGQEDVEHLTEQTVPVVSGWTESYGRWWQEKTATGHGSILFTAQMIGDARTPMQYTCMSLTDLACCRYAYSYVLHLYCAYKGYPHWCYRCTLTSHCTHLNALLQQMGVQQSYPACL